MKRIEDSLRDLWENIKHMNIRIIGVLEEEEKKKGIEKIFEETIVEKFPNIGKELVNQVQEAQRVPYRISPRRNTSRHILIKLSKIKYKGGFPGGAVVENLPANAGDTGSSPGLGRSHMLRSSWAREPQLLSLRIWSLCSTTRGRNSERPTHRDEEWPPLTATRESPRTETKTQHSQK